MWTGLAGHLALFGVWIPVLSVVGGFLLLPLAAIGTTLVVIIVAAFVPSLRGIVALDDTTFKVRTLNTMIELRTPLLNFLRLPSP